MWPIFVKFRSASLMVVDEKRKKERRRIPVKRKSTADKYSMSGGLIRIRSRASAEIARVVRHKPGILPKTRLPGLHFVADSVGGTTSVKFGVRPISHNVVLCEMKCVFQGHGGHPTLPILVPIENPYLTSY